jgi:2-oxo-3-hexenedioate decarboxylase/2-keto-4-pentenoate hydratase
MDKSAREAVADTLAAARLRGDVIDLFAPDMRPQTLSDAYDAQDTLHDRLVERGHGRLAGHKIGCTTPVMREFLGIPSPCAGGIFDHTAHDLEGKFPFDDYRHVGVECEIAVRLGANLDIGPYDRAEVSGAVASVMAAIEVVDDRYNDYPSFDTPTLVADDFFNAGCVLGTPMENWQALDLSAVPGTMVINGQEVGHGVGGDIMGHPFEALAWLATMRAGRGTPLRAGEFVLLGSVVATKWVERGDTVEIQLDGLGQARATFE